MLVTFFLPKPVALLNLYKHRYFLRISADIMAADEFIFFSCASLPFTLAITIFRSNNSLWTLFFWLNVHLLYVEGIWFSTVVSSELFQNQKVH